MGNCRELTRDNLTVIYGESDGEDVFFVSNEPASGLSRSNIPKAQLGVPTGRKGKGTIGGDDDIRNKVVVSAKGLTCVTIGIVVTGRRVRELPDHYRLVARRRKKEVGIFGSGGKGSDPVAVSLQRSAQS